MVKSILAIGFATNLLIVNDVEDFKKAIDKAVNG